MCSYVAGLIRVCHRFFADTKDVMGSVVIIVIVQLF